MARATKEEALKTRQRILDTAIYLFYRDGVSTTTIENIAESAELTRGAVYWHFKNKLDLIRAIHEDLHLAILTSIHDQLENVSISPVNRLKNASRKFLLDLAGNELQQMVLTIFTVRCDYSGEMSHFLEDQDSNKTQAAKLFARCFQEALDNGDITTRWTAEFLAHTHTVFLEGIINEYVRSRKIAALTRDVDVLLEFYFHKIIKDEA